MVIIVAVVFAIMIFPLFLQVYLFTDIRSKRLLIKIKLFGLKIFKLSAKLDGGRIWIKRTFKRPYCIKITNAFKSSGKLFRFKGVGVLQLSSILNVGVSGDFFYPDLAISSVFTAENLVLQAIRVKRPHLKTQNVVNVYENSAVLNVFFRASLIINVFFVIINIVSNLTEMIVNYAKR